MVRFFIFIFWFIPNLAIGCSCGNSTPFEELAKREDLIFVKAKIVSYWDYHEGGDLSFVGPVPQLLIEDQDLLEGYITANAPRAGSMIAIVQHRYRGDLESPVIKVWGDDGVLCRPYVSEFEEGGIYILALQRLRSEESSEGGIVQLYISICGEFWLKEEDGVFIGQNPSDLYRSSVLSIDDLTDLFSNKHQQ